MTGTGVSSPEARRWAERCPRTWGRGRAIKGSAARPSGGASGGRAPREVGRWSSAGRVNGGDEGSRTLDLRIANATLYQLSYVPTRRQDSAGLRRGKGPGPIGIRSAGPSSGGPGGSIPGAIWPLCGSWSGPRARGWRRDRSFGQRVRNEGRRRWDRGGGDRGVDGRPSGEPRTLWPGEGLHASTSDPNLDKRSRRSARGPGGGNASGMSSSDGTWRIRLSF